MGGLVSPWQPMTNSLDLKHLGKLGEELGELSAAVSRCIIQGITESEPVTGKPNKQWLEEEIADVYANIHLVISRFELDGVKIIERSIQKTARLQRWHGMLNI
jgi:NTP pyrophosphatase (non-canonical NTP hydrolase)